MKEMVSELLREALKLERANYSYPKRFKMLKNDMIMDILELCYTKPTLNDIFIFFNNGKIDPKEILERLYLLLENRCIFIHKEKVKIDYMGHILFLSLRLDIPPFASHFLEVLYSSYRLTKCEIVKFTRERALHDAYFRKYTKETKRKAVKILKRKGLIEIINNNKYKLTPKALVYVKYDHLVEP